MGGCHADDTLHFIVTLLWIGRERQHFSDTVCPSCAKCNMQAWGVNPNRCQDSGGISAGNGMHTSHPRVYRLITRPWYQPAAITDCRINPY